MDHLIAGLGNPGDKYQNTRHNIGFLSIDKLSETYRTTVQKKFKKSRIAQIFVNDDNLILMKPMTFMNLSGKVILSGLARFRIKPENLIVIFDDIDLPLGKIRIRPGGSAGGHRGVQSIIDYLQNDKFIRIRMGIKSITPDHRPSEDFVLEEFSQSEIKEISECIEKIPQIIDTLLHDSINKAMNDFN